MWGGPGQGRAGKRRTGGAGWVRSEHQSMMGQGGAGWGRVRWGAVGWGGVEGLDPSLERARWIHSTNLALSTMSVPHCAHSRLGACGAARAPGELSRCGRYTVGAPVSVSRPCARQARFSTEPEGRDGQGDAQVQPHINAHCVVCSTGCVRRCVPAHVQRGGPQEAVVEVKFTMSICLTSITGQDFHDGGQAF